MESVDHAAMPFPVDLKCGQANGVRGVCRLNWRLASRALNRFEKSRLFLSIVFVNRRANFSAVA